MSGAWRTGEGRTVVQCDDCGSRGTTHVQVKMVMTDAAKALLESQAVRGAAIHQKFEADWRALAARIKAKEAGPDEAAALLQAYEADVGKLGAEPLDGIGFVVESCPWCKARIDAPLVLLRPGEQEPAQGPPVEEITGEEMVDLNRTLGLTR